MLLLLGNTEILKRIGINLGNNYEQNKQNFESEEKVKNQKKVENIIDDENKYFFSNDKIEAELKSVSIDNVTLVMEIDLKLNEKLISENPDLKVKNINIFRESNKSNLCEDLIITEKNSVEKIEDGTYKLFKYLAIKDTSLGSNDFWNDVFYIDETVKCTVTFEKFSDKNKNEQIDLDNNSIFKFDLKRSDLNKNEVEVNKAFNYKGVNLNIKSVNQSSFGNIITMEAKQENIDFDTVNDIQKLKFTVQDSDGNKVNIVSETKNIVLTDYKDGKYTSIILDNIQLVVDDTSIDPKYSIKVEEDNKINISSSELKKINSELMENKKSGKFVMTSDGVAYPMDNLTKDFEYYIDDYGVYRIDKSAKELSDAYVEYINNN